MRRSFELHGGQGHPMRAEVADLLSIAHHSSPDRSTRPAMPPRPARVLVHPTRRGFARRSRLRPLSSRPCPSRPRAATRRRAEAQAQPCPVTLRWLCSSRGSGSALGNCARRGSRARFRGRFRRRGRLAYRCRVGRRARVFDLLWGRWAALFDDAAGAIQRLRRRASWGSK